MGSNIHSTEILKKSEKGLQMSPDIVVVEEPLEIRVGYGPSSSRCQHSVSVTMRTPGEDELLGIGFLFNEGIIDSFDELLSIKHCDDLGQNEIKDNVVRAELSENKEFKVEQFSRNFYINSSCGICGKGSIEAIHQVVLKKPTFDGTLSSAIVQQIPDSLLESQHIFQHTGGLHASGLFTKSGKLVAHFEDVGRHNALDKLVGGLMVKKCLPASNQILAISGRISFELVQKALRAGIGMIVAVGAPSSLAIQLAKEFDVTLIGFVRNNQFNIYSGKDRIIP